MSTAQVHSATYTPKGEGGKKNTKRKEKWRNKKLFFRKSPKIEDRKQKL